MTTSNRAIVRGALLVSILTLAFLAPIAASDPGQLTAKPAVKPAPTTKITYGDEIRTGPGERRRVMLPGGATETGQRVVRDIMAALHGDLLDGVRHILDCYAHAARRDLFRRVWRARRARHLLRKRRKTAAHDLCVE